MEKKLETARTYVRLREETDYAKLREILADDMHFLGGRGEDITGADEFIKHLEKNPPSGSKWEEPIEDEDGKSVILLRKMGVKFLTITIFCKFGFNDEGKINYVHQGRK